VYVKISIASSRPTREPKPQPRFDDNVPFKSTSLIAKVLYEELNKERDVIPRGARSLCVFDVPRVGSMRMSSFTHSKVVTII